MWSIWNLWTELSKFESLILCQEKQIPFRVSAFLYTEIGIRTHLNTICRWHIAHARLDGHDTTISSNPSSSAKKHLFSKENGCFFLPIFPNERPQKGLNVGKIRPHACFHDFEKGISSFAA